jgi:CxC2 like cysteine cluster associated with KDZ transposases
MHVNGVHHVNIDFCDCGSMESPSPHPRVQLLRMGWFPATFERPKTAFTFDLLKLFHKVTLQGKTTLYDFYQAILQVSDSLELEKSTVSRYLLSLDHYKPKLIVK